MTDRHNASTPHEMKDDEYSVLSSELYSEGIKKLYQNNIKLIPHSSGRYAYHKVYTLSGLGLEDTDINYPENFKVWREISTEGQKDLLHNVIAGWQDEELVKFWWPLVQPNKAKSSHIYTYTENILYEQGLDYIKNSGEPFVDYHTPKPVVGDSASSIKAYAPISWIPLEDWFPEAVRGLRIDDFLTIFPEAERELLATILGRAIVGRSNSLPPGWTKPITHTSRMAAICLGEDPGLGKSTLFKAIFTALESVGFHVETIHSFGARFNLADPITSQIIYKDDLTDQDLRNMVRSGVLKSVISGTDKIKVENKGIDAFNVFPRAVLITNTNNFNPWEIYGIDPGMADRLKVISTLREKEIPQIEVSRLSEGSPDYRPFTHIPYLASKLGCHQKTLMLWLARLCADKFLSLIQDRTSLEIKVDELTLRLREPLYKDVTSQLLSLVMLVGLTTKKDTWSDFIGKEPPSQIQGLDWNEAFSRLWFIMHHNNFFRDNFSNFLREDFEALGEPDYFHPWIALNQLDIYSLKNWVETESLDHIALTKSDYLLWLKNCMKVLRCKNGLNYTPNEVRLNKAYSKIYYYWENLCEIYDRINKLPEEKRKFFHKAS